MSLPVILNQVHYVNDLVEQINHPETCEVWIQAMVFSPRGEKLKSLTEALHDLLKRGGKATIITDYYNYLRPEDYEPNRHLHEPYYLQEVKNIHEAYRDAKSQFEKAGGTWFETNRDPITTKFIDVWNRNHMKSAGILKKNGEKSVYLGGCNIYPHAMDFIDFMVRFDEEVVFDKVKTVTEMLLHRLSLSDTRIPCTEDFSVFIDGGRFPGKSIIFSQALSLIKQPDLKALYLTTQLPTDPIVQAELEKAATSGVNVHIFIPNPEKTNVLNEGVGKWLYNRMVAAEKKIAKYYLYRAVEKKVHAKLLVSESMNGDISSFWGSNNYFILGPLLCTPEIQVLSTNQEFNHMVRDFFWNMVEGAAEAAPAVFPSVATPLPKPLQAAPAVNPTRP